MSGVQVQLNNKGMAIYVTSFSTYDRPGSIPAQCNSIVFINQGNSIAVINGHLKLFPQQSIAIDGNKYEWDNTNYQLNFDTTSGTNNQLVVVRKTYQ